MSQRQQGRRVPQSRGIPNGPRRGNGSTGDLGGNRSSGIPVRPGVHVGDGLGKEEPSPGVEGDDGPLTEEEQQALAAAMVRQMGLNKEGGWVPACAQCINDQKVAIAELMQRLVSAGVSQDSPQFGQAIQQAAQLGQMLAQGHPVPDGQAVIPAVRRADTMVNGNALCGPCFIPVKKTGLIAGSAGQASQLLTGSLSNWRN